MKNTYWNYNGKHQTKVEILHDLIDSYGFTDDHKMNGHYKNPHLERLRKAKNCYYDLYNNGLWNCKKQFARLFDMAPNAYFNSWRQDFSESLYEEVEEKMNVFIERAWKEQYES